MNDHKPADAAKSRVKFFRSHIARGLAVVGVVGCIATGTWAVEESAKLGLRGIYPAAAPDDLSVDEFAKLNGNWATWSQGTAAAVADFYTKLETADVASQRAGLKALKAKLDVMQRAISDPRYASLLDPLVLLHGRLSQRVEIGEAALDTLELDPKTVAATKLADKSKGITAAIAGLKTSLASVPNGLLWLPYVKADVVEKALAKPGDEAVAAVQLAKDRIAGRSNLSDEKQKEFLGRPEFVKYEEALDQYLAASTWKPAAGSEEALRTQLKALLDASNDYATSHASEDAAKIRAAYVEVSKLALDGGDGIGLALQKYILNYNIRILASEEFLSRILADTRTERGPIVDNVLGAAVSGNQVTTTKVSVDLRPSNGTARFDLLLNGQISSNTVGVTSEATVYTQGNHTFLARKEINFDGVKFTTAPATISVNPHNTTTGVGTNIGGPLFGGIAQNIASNEVEARRGQAEAIVGSRVRDSVLPKYNAEVDKAFANAGSKLDNELFSGLKATGLYPDAFVYQSTDNLLRLNTRLMGAGEVGADIPRVVAPTDRGATLFMHESAVNNAIDRMGLAGQTLNDHQLQEKLEAFFSKALSHEVKFEAPKKEESSDEEKGPSAIKFADRDPIRVGFNDGELTLVIHAGFKREGKDDIPEHEIKVPITFEVKGQKIVVTRQNVVVFAVNGDGNAVISRVVSNKIKSELPDREVDGKVELKGPNSKVVSYVTGIKLVDRWVVVTIN